MNKKSMWEVKKISRFLSTGHGILPSCGCKARVACVASVPIRAELKYRAARRSFRVREARKMGREQKGRGKGGGGGALLSPSHPPPSSFLLSPHFPRFPNTKTPSRGPILKFGSYGNACYAGKARETMVSKCELIL